MFEKILVCLDGSRLAEQILPYATEQATRFNSQVVLLQAFIIPSSIVAAGAEASMTVNSDMVQEEAQRLETEAKSYLEEIAMPLREKGLDVTCVALQGMAGAVIISLALATHGHSGLGRVIFGSVADHVLRESGLPILIIRPQ